MPPGILFQRPARGKPSPVRARRGVSCPLGSSAWSARPSGPATRTNRGGETMKSKKVSLRRRQVMIAGLAGTAAPALAGQFHGRVRPSTSWRGRGRRRAWSSRDAMLAANGRPLAGAAVEVWRANARGGRRQRDHGRRRALLCEGRVGSARPPAPHPLPRQRRRANARHAGAPFRARTRGGGTALRSSAARRSPAPGAPRSAFHLPETAAHRSQSGEP